MSNTPKRLITHSEEFHTDDVFAAALLLALFPDAVVTRSRDDVVIATGDIVYDVGKVFDPARGRFDHHQAQAGKRENGIVYSSFGLLWREYGRQYSGGDEEVWQEIDLQLVTPIDAIDNGQKITTSDFEGIEPFTIDDVVSSFNPQPWVDANEDHDTQFMKAVAMATQVLERVHMATKNRLLSQRYLLDLYKEAEDKRLLITDKQADVSGVLAQCSELLYVVSPRVSGQWGVLAVSTERGAFTPRKPFPEAWRAQLPEKLAELSGVADMRFCHATGFYAAAGTKEGAIAVACKALET